MRRTRTARGRTANEWVADLDAAAARAETPAQRTALDPNRLGAFEAAQRLDDAIPMLEQSEKDFPQDYNPPARLAVVYLKLKRYDEAIAASDRALELVYGPRRIRVLSTIADIQLGKGDRAGARKTLEEAVTFADGVAGGAALGGAGRLAPEKARLAVARWGAAVHDS